LRPALDAVVLELLFSRPAPPALTPGRPPARQKVSKGYPKNLKSSDLFLRIGPAIRMAPPPCLLQSSAPPPPCPARPRTSSLFTKLSAISPRPPVLGRPSSQEWGVRLSVSGPEMRPNSNPLFPGFWAERFSSPRFCWAPAAPGSLRPPPPFPAPFPPPAQMPSRCRNLPWNLSKNHLDLGPRSSNPEPPPSRPNSRHIPPPHRGTLIGTVPGRPVVGSSKHARLGVFVLSPVAKKMKSRGPPARPPPTILPTGFVFFFLGRNFGPNPAPPLFSTPGGSALIAA